MLANLWLGVTSSNWLPAAPPTRHTSRIHRNVRPRTGEELRYTQAEAMPPGTRTTAEVALAQMGLKPANNSAGNVRKVPPPASALATPATKDTTSSRTQESADTSGKTSYASKALYDGNVDDKTFSPPRVALNRIYTKTGDAGDTHLAGGQRVAKDSTRIEAYGTVDELNAFVGLAGISCAEGSSAHLQLGRLSAILRRIQHELFNLGSILATLPADVHPKQARVTPAEVEQLEREIDAMNADLAPLRSFVLPGGSRLNAELHAARTICRRAERQVVALARSEEVPPEAVRYLNRLSDALFVWSRWANHVMGVEEVLWEPNQAASGQGSTR